MVDRLTQKVYGKEVVALPNGSQPRLSREVRWLVVSVHSLNDVVGRVLLDDLAKTTSVKRVVEQSLHSYEREWG